MFAPNLFAHLKPVATKFHEHVLGEARIPSTNAKPIVLQLKYCGNGTAFWNASKKWNKLADEVAASKRAAEAFARHGVGGWLNVEEDGKPVAYTEELGTQVFGMLIDADRMYWVDIALAAAMNPDNFTEAAPDGREVGKK